MHPTADALPSSFRDPSGFLFKNKHRLYRQVNQSYQTQYDLLMGSGLYDVLVEHGMLIAHEEVDIEAPIPATAYKILEPELVQQISYPYEWCFSQLQDAALLTLEIEKKALEHALSLKDCSAYNVQFKEGKPIFIDTLSFEPYVEGEPWVAYKQFCQHFLAPLALMSYKDIRLNQLFRIYIDGVPLDLASTLLPFGSRFKFSILSHIHLHARSQRHYANRANVQKENARKMSRHSFLALIDNLEGAVKKLRPPIPQTEWGNYYQNTNYDAPSFTRKKELVGEYLDLARSSRVWDLGANTGEFSRIASQKGISTVAFDIDPVAVEKNYLQSKAEKETSILPLLLDLTNPSPGIGWHNDERDSLLSRGPVDTVMALAVVHHLAISNNVPLSRIAHFFSALCRSLIIEFVPKSDSQVKRLLATREDIFPQYNQEDFAKYFGAFFKILRTEKVGDSERTLYLMANLATQA